MARPEKHGLLVTGLVLVLVSVSGLVFRTPVRAAGLRDGRRASASASAVSEAKTLGYIAGCALEAGDSVLLSPGGNEQRFEGQFGLAKGWKTDAMSPDEQRWLSACLAARTNLFGRKVLVSMRGSHPSLAARPPNAPSADPWTIEEGAFYGDVFGERPITYACSGDHEPASNGVLADRVCTERHDGSSTTRCGFVYAGRCSDVCERDETGSFYRRCRGGADLHEEVITVHLTPSGRGIRAAR